MVRDSDQILSVLRYRKTDVAIGASRIVVACDSTSIAVVNVDHRIESRSCPSCETLDVKNLPLLGHETKDVNIPRFGNDPIKRVRQFDRRRICEVVIGFLLKTVAELGDSEGDRRR